jgi:hypothetical protein
MQKLWIFLIACILFGTVTVHAALTVDRVIVGVNVTGVQRMNAQQQDVLLEQLQHAGVNTVRTGISSLAPAEGLTNFVSKAYKRGIGTIFIVNPTEGGTGLHTRPAIPPHDWPQSPMSDADPEGFRKWLSSLLGLFEASGVRLQLNSAMKSTTPNLTAILRFRWHPIGCWESVISITRRTREDKSLPLVLGLI